MTRAANRKGGFTFPWPGELVEGRLITRHERFIAEVKLGRRTVLAHCVNPGRMEGMVVPGARVWLSRATNPARKLAFTWELMELDGQLLGANTGLPNRLVEALLQRAALIGWHDVERVAREQPFGKHHRVDFVVQRSGVPWHVEVKNCHLVYPDGVGYFPDSASVRAASHAAALGRLAAKGRRAAVLFTLQRHDVSALRPSALHDPVFARALRLAARRGVDLLALRFTPSLQGLTFDAVVPVDVKPYDVEPLRPWARALEATSGWRRTDGRWAGHAPR